MKIIYVVQYYPPYFGAAPLNTERIVNNLINFGHEVLILVPKNMGKKYKNSSELSELKNLNIEYSSSLIKYPFSLILSHYENAAKFLIKLKSRFSPDLILSQYHAFHYASVAGSYLSRKLNLPFIIRSHDIFFNKENFSLPFTILNSILYPKIYRSILRCNIFYVVCSELKNYMLKSKKFNGFDIRVSHNGIDTKKFYPIDNQDELKNKYGCENIIIFSGSLAPDIGLQDFIPILPEILKNNKDTHIIFLGSGSFKDYVIKYLQNRKTSKQVHFLGIKKHDEIPYYINNSDIGIGRITHNKIWKYSIPVKCLEYLACKKPFISTPISDDIIKNEEVGIILKRNFTKKEIRDNFIMLIEDKNLQRRLGENGFKKIQNEFRWEDIMERFNKDLGNIQVNN
ncbi:MAG: glycosyltransferase [Promethearchaeota archaeon]